MLCRASSFPWSDLEEDRAVSEEARLAALAVAEAESAAAESALPDDVSRALVEWMASREEDEGEHAQTGPRPHSAKLGMAPKSKPTKIRPMTPEEKAERLAPAAATLRAAPHPARGRLAAWSKRVRRRPCPCPLCPHSPSTASMPTAMGCM